jgi:hypothetical protein
MRPMRRFDINEEANILSATVWTVMLIKYRKTD